MVMTDVHPRVMCDTVPLHIYVTWFYFTFLDFLFILLATRFH